MIALTGVTGAVGGRVAALLTGRPLRLLARDPARAPHVEGAETVAFDYADRDSLTAGLEGVDVLFFVSGAESAQRRRHHRNVVDAAREAGVGHVVYTSFAGASPDATFTLGRDHADTEAAIHEAGLTATLLRDNLYSDLLPFFADDTGTIVGPAGDGRVAAVARADVAATAAAVLREPARHAGRTYTLTGPEALTMAELAARAGAALGRPLRFVDQTVQEAYAQRAADYPGTPDWQLDAWVSTYVAIRDGSLAEVTGDVERLTGRPPLTIEQALTP
jgi:NAD(P)H dehydrogenase (quinone)